MVGSYLLIATAVTGGLLVGFFPRLLEALREPLGKRLAIDAARVADLHVWLSLALVPMLFVSGLLLDRWGSRQVLFIGGLLLAGSLTTLALSQGQRSVVFGLMVLGAAGACVTTSATVLMPSAFFGVAQAARSVNLGYVVVALTALTTPLLLEILIGRLGFRNAMLMLALAALIPAALAALTPGDDFPVTALLASVHDLLADPRLWMIGIVFLVYYPLERSVHTWPQAYFSELDFTPRRVAWLWAGFWGMFLLARLGSGLLLTFENEVWLVLVLVILTAIIHGNLVGVYDRSPAAWTCLMLGGVFGPVFPTLLGVSLDLFADHGTGTAIGTLYALGLLGSLFFQPFMRVFSQTHRVRATMRLPMILGLLLGAPLLILALIRY